MCIMLNTVAIIYLYKAIAVIMCDELVRAYALMPYLPSENCDEKRVRGSQRWMRRIKANVLNLMIINIFAFHAACVRTNHFSDILCALSSVGFVLRRKSTMCWELYIRSDILNSGPHKIQLHIHRHTWFISNNKNSNGKATTKYRWRRWNPCLLWTECCCKVKQIQ